MKTFISAFSGERTLELNAELHSKLKNDLRVEGLTVLQAKSYFSGESTPTLCVFHDGGNSLQPLIQAAKTLGQDSLLHVDNESNVTLHFVKGGRVQKLGRWVEITEPRVADIDYVSMMGRYFTIKTSTMNTYHTIDMTTEGLNNDTLKEFLVEAVEYCLGIYTDALIKDGAEPQHLPLRVAITVDPKTSSAKVTADLNLDEGG